MRKRTSIFDHPQILFSRVEKGIVCAILLVSAWPYGQAFIISLVYTHMDDQNMNPAPEAPEGAEGAEGADAPAEEAAPAEGAEESAE